MRAGAFSIRDARIVQFSELSRLHNSCIYRSDNHGYRVFIPFSAVLRNVDVAADLSYDMYFTGTRGGYKGTFSHISMNGTIEAWPFENRMTLRDFSITDSKVIDDDIQIGLVPKWMMAWVSGYFAKDNTSMYERLARVVVERQVANFKDFAYLREILRTTQIKRMGSIALNI